MIGQTVSHYEILEKLGEGGMGVVYKAKDTKLEREVALKFLPSHTIASEDDKQRFVQEAQAAASLGHTNIATVFGIDEHDDDMFIVMEYIEGQTLRDKIKEGPLKLKDTIKIIQQIAEGLAAAHEKGIVHRDVKSNNIMLTGKNQAKIMDFGLAKIEAGSMVTRPGTTLGTIAYMSPEQARSESVDHRSDIFSLGVILYEMITGQLPFKGEYETAMVYSIINVDPEPLTAVRTGIPMELERIVNKLLAKDPGNRYQNVIELPVDINAIDLKSKNTKQVSMKSNQEHYVKQPVFWQKTVVWQLFSLVILIFCTFSIWFLISKYSPAEQNIMRFYTTYSDTNHLLGGAHYGRDLDISPDGKFLVYVATDGITRQLYLRSLERINSNVLPGTEDAYNPFFSHDGQSIGYFANGKLKRINLSSGESFTICQVGPNNEGATWGPDDMIIFSRGGGWGLIGVSAFGGNTQELTVPDPERGEIGHYWPEFLPDGNTVLFTIRKSGKFMNWRMAKLSLDTETWQILLEEGGTDAHYSSTGHIVYALAGLLKIAPFDLENLEITGPSKSLNYNVNINFRGGADYSLSNDGTLIYVPEEKEAIERTLVWVNRDGDETQVTNEKRAYWMLRLSNNGNQAALCIEQEKMRDIWILDFESESTLHRRTLEEAIDPVMDTGGKRLVFASDREGIYNIYAKPVDGSEEAVLLLENEIQQFPVSFSPDGKHLAFYELDQFAQRNISIYSFEDSTTRQFLGQTHNEYSPMFSPNGKWIAYVSNESGREEVYVQPFPGPGGKHKISNNGGREPVWSRNGLELFYREGNKMMAASVEARSTFKADAPKKLFEGKYYSYPYVPTYDVHPDGNRFLMVKVENESIKNCIIIVLNWFDEMKEEFSDRKK
ncbi:protein kinase [candidate division KSB1 bacterium]